MDLKSLLETITSSATTTAVISFSSAIALAFLVLGSNDALKSLGLLEFRDDYRTVLGLLFIFSTVAFGVHVVIFVWDKAFTAVSRRLVIRGRQKDLYKLTGPEKAILGRFIDNETKTQSLDNSSGVVQRLSGNRIIYRASTMGHWDSWDFNIHDWAWDYLLEHPESLHFRGQSAFWETWKRSMVDRLGRTEDQAHQVTGANRTGSTQVKRGGRMNPYGLFFRLMKWGVRVNLLIAVEACRVVWVYVRAYKIAPSLSSRIIHEDQILDSLEGLRKRAFSLHCSDVDPRLSGGPLRHQLLCLPTSG